MRIDISNRIGTTSNFGGFRGLLDKFSGAAAGYSLRKLSKSATNAVRVRRSSDNTEQNIGFVGTDLDTTTLLDFVNARDVAPADYGAGAAAAYSLRYVSDSYTGDVVRVRRDSDNAEADFNPTEITDGTLLAWVGNTASDNGYVTTWYDQSGNSNDATQGTAASQPKIVDAGVLVEENGKPAILLDGTDDYLVSTNAYPTQQYQSTFYVASSTGTNNRVLDTRGTGASGTIQGWQHKFSSSNDVTAIDNGSGIDLQTTSILRTGQDLVSVFMYGGSGSSIDEYTNGSLSDSNTDVNNIDFNSGNDLYIGANVNGANSQLFGGKIQDIILYNTDQSSNRGNIEANVNDYYSIYTSTNDGFVTTWYDQAGNANNATQATAASQPQIVSSGSIITNSGYQVIQYDGGDDNLSTSFTATGTMLMGGSDGGAFYEVAVSGAYNLLANATNTDHPLKESIRVVWGRTLSAGEQSAIESRVTYSDWDFSDVTDFTRYWRQRSELTSFPLIDTSNGTNFFDAWRDCTSLTSFPLLDVSNGTNFFRAWRTCNSLTSFPLLDVSNGTNFQNAWDGCSSLEDFPANMFDSVTATNFTNAFFNTNLTQTSIDNILVSIDTAGQSGGTFDQSGGSAPSAVGEAAIDNLRARGWTVTVTGGY